MTYVPKERWKKDTLFLFIRQSSLTSSTLLFVAFCLCRWTVTTHHLNVFKLQDDVIVCHQMSVAVRHSSRFKPFKPSGTQRAWVHWGQNFREMVSTRQGKQKDKKTNRTQSEQSSHVHKFHCSHLRSFYECLLLCTRQLDS